MLGAVVPAGLQKAHTDDVVLNAFRAEAEVLVVATDLLIVEINVEELSLPERLGHALIEGQTGHGFVSHLRVEANHL